MYMIYIYISSVEIDLLVSFVHLWKVNSLDGRFTARKSTGQTVNGNYRVVERQSQILTKNR